MGRPTKYTAKLADDICTRIANGENLRRICADEGYPARSSVMSWLASSNKTYAGFREQYARAMSLRADYWADEILEIADDGSNDWVPRKRAGGASDAVLNHEHVTRSRLRVDTRKWLMARMEPKKYGDRVQNELSGTLGVQKIERTIVDPHAADPDG